MDTLEKLRRSWPIIKWLDDARWSGRGSQSTSSGMPGPVFASLDNRGKILAHWVCYITDQQRPSQQAWEGGLPIFAEIVAKYLANARQREDVVNLLADFTRQAHDPKRGVDEFISHRQKIDDAAIGYTPRYGTQLVSIARCLAILLRYERDIVTYISANDGFWLRPDGEDDSPIWRIAFLLHLLAYDSVPKGMRSFHSQRAEFAGYLEERDREVSQLLHDQTSLENRYRAWVVRWRFHKRLWAAFRDYVKPGSYYEKVFIERLNKIGSEEAVFFFAGDRNELLSWLELPGDVWNLRFFRRLFGGDIPGPDPGPEYLRNCYATLRVEGLPNTFYPEQFDISFDFAPRMCDLRSQDLCPFVSRSRVDAYCLGDEGTSDKLCPVTRILCGYESTCRTEDCPVLRGTMDDLCAGCALRIAV